MHRVPSGVTYAPIRAESARDEFKSFLKSNPTVGAVSQPMDLGSLLVIAAVGLRRLTLAANKLWTKRYIQSTIPTP